MSEVVQVAVLGLGAGAVYSLLAQGAVLIFRGSGVLNLAHGALAMLAAYLFNVFREEQGWPVVGAVLACVAITAAIGLLTDQIVLRRLRGASPLSRLIATLGVLLVIQSIAALKWAGVLIVVPPLFEQQVVDIFGASVAQDRLVMVGIAIVITLLLTAIWRYTRVGWVTEAVSENPQSAAALGWSPEAVSAATWAAGGALAGFAGVLIAPITQLSVTNLTLIVIAAFAAALIGGFRSFPLTLLGAMAVGIAQAEVGNYVDITGAAGAVPFLIIVLVLALRGSPLPLRGYIFDRLPSVGTGRIDLRIAAPLFAAGVIAVSLITSATWLSAISATFAVAIILLSLLVLIGYAGQVSLAQYAIAGIGALIAAKLVDSQGWGFPLALLAGMLGATLVGLLFALPALRTRGVNLAVVTLGLGLATQDVVFNNVDITGSVSGISVGSQSLLGWSIDPSVHPGRYAVVVLVLFAVSVLAVSRLRRGAAGRRLLAVRANERAAAAAGIDVIRTKLLAFAVAGALAGLGGVVLGFGSTAVTFEQFNPIASLTAVAQTVIGGVGYLAGPVLGATLAPSSIGSIIAVDWQDISEYLPLVAGVLLLFMLVDAPDGAARALARRFRRLTGRPAPVPQPPPEIATRPEPRRVEPKVLSVEDLSVHYGGVKAVSGLCFRVHPGEIVALIGPNGAGKTTVIDAIGGFTSYRGTIALDGRPLGRMPAYRRARAGLARSFQALELFSDMTVLENLQAASDHERRGWGRAPLPPAAISAIHDFDLADCLGRYPDELSYGQRRLVAIARAVAMEPSVLLLDEPVAGLDENESREFAGLVRRLADVWGIAILVVEHDMEFVMGVADRVVVIDFGNEVAHGTPDEVARDPRAIAAYLGEAETVDEPVAARADQQPQETAR